MYRVLTSLAVLLAVATLILPAQSGTRSKARNWQPPPPVKDCTRVNARYGYYGNPWCSPAEQQAFDRAEARRLAR
jgi:hypothetical protein